MRRILPLAWRGMRYRRRSTGMLLGAVIIAVTFFTVVGLVGSSAIHTADVQNRDQFGEQKILLLDPDQSVRRKVAFSADFSVDGKMQAVGLVKQISGDMPVVIGTMDDAAVKTAHIRLKSGRLPRAAGEIALEQAAFARLGIERDLYPGDHVKLDVEAADGQAARQSEFTLTGILENYTSLWAGSYHFEATRGYEKDTPFYPLSGVIFPSDAKAFAGGFPALWLLGSSRQGWKYRELGAALGGDAMYAANTEVYPKLYASGEIATGESVSILAVVAFTAGMLLLAVVLIILNAFLLLIERRRQQLALLRTIGATKRQARLVIAAEALILFAAGTPAGLAAGSLFSYGAVLLFSAASGMKLLFMFHPAVLPAAAMVSLLAVFLSVLLPSIKAGRISPIANVRPRPRRKHASRIRLTARTTPARLMLSSMKRGKMRAFLTILSFVIGIFFANAAFLYYRSNQSYLDRLNNSADYSLYAKGSVSYDTETGLVFSDKRDPQDLSSGFLDVIRKTVKTGSVTCGAMAAFRFIQEGERVDEYQKGTYDSYGYNHLDKEEQVRYGIHEQDFLRNPDIRLMDEAAVAALADDVDEGGIHLDQIMAGKEIVLYIPDFAVEITEENGCRTIRTYTESNFAEKPESIPTLTSSTYHVGDTVIFTSLTGNIQGATADHPPKVSDVKRKDTAVKIGAIIRTADTCDDLTEPMIMVIGEKALDSLGLPYTITDAEVRLSGNADIEESDRAMLRLASSYANLNVSLKTGWIAYARQDCRQMVTILVMLTFCIGLMGLMGLMNTVSGRILNRRREINMLRSIGMTKGQALRMLVYEGALYGVLAAVAGAGFCLFSTRTIMKDWSAYQSAGFLIAAAAVCVAMGIVTVLLPARRVLNEGLIDGIRMPE